MTRSPLTINQMYEICNSVQNETNYDLADFFDSFMHDADLGIFLQLIHDEVAKLKTEAENETKT